MPVQPGPLPTDLHLLCCVAQAADLKETLPGSFKLMEIPQTSSRCSFAFMTSDVNLWSGPCRTTISGSKEGGKLAAGRGKNNSAGGWPGVLTCPNLLPARYCGGVADVVGSCTLPPRTPNSNSSATVRPLYGQGDAGAVFTSVSVVRAGINQTSMRVPPFLANCTLNMTDLGNNLQLTTRRECNIGSTVWGAGCECMKEWLYTTPAGTDQGPFTGCQPIDFTTPW
jgi:hypothetical protein